MKELIFKNVKEVLTEFKTLKTKNRFLLRTVYRINWDHFSPGNEIPVKTPI